MRKTTSWTSSKMKEIHQSARRYMPNCLHFENQFYSISLHPRGVWRTAENSQSYPKESGTMTIREESQKVIIEALKLFISQQWQPQVVDIADMAERGKFCWEFIPLYRYSLGELYAQYLDRYCTAQRTSRASEIPAIREKLQIIKETDLSL